MVDGAPPAAGSPQGGAPDKAPFGQTSATGPSPNQGYEAQALQQLGVAIKQMEQLVPLVGANSELGMEILKTLPRLAKFSPPGAVTPAGEQNAMTNALLRNARQTSLLQQIKAAQAQAQAGGGAPGGAPGMPGGGATGGAPGGMPGAGAQPRMM